MTQKSNKIYCSDKCRVFSFREKNGIKEPEFLKKGGFQPLGSIETSFNYKTIEGLNSLHLKYGEIFTEKLNLIKLKKIEVEKAKKPIQLSTEKVKVSFPLIDWSKVEKIQLEITNLKQDLDSIKPYLSFINKENILEKGLISKEIDRIQSKIETEVKNTNMNNSVLASDLMKKNLRFYDFSNSEFEFLSNPGTAFICLISGEPGAGKTYFSLKFAEFLTKFGTVLFISNEEKMKFSFINKLNSIFKDKEPKFNITDNFDIKEVLNYDFIFMDSINSIGASTLDLKNLQSKNKNIIGILQSTKTGNYKGSKEFEHEADIMLYVETNKGISVKKNRF
jgi:hypothetical protein